MAASGAGQDIKPKVFISYSRRDLEFADQLVAVLDWLGFKTSIDRKGIHGAEQWETRLGQLILESDVIVFVLSPDSAASEVCNWEVEEAARRGKRVIPVLCRALQGSLPHPRLRDLNYIYFYAEPDVPGSGFGTRQLRLVEALSVDMDWVREHTRLEEMAVRWERSARGADLLARGSELTSYRQWRERRPANAPDLTDLQRAFLAASEEEEAARGNAERRRLAEMATAQEDRQAALEAREQALRREAQARQAGARARRAITALVAVMVIAAVAGYGLLREKDLKAREIDLKNKERQAEIQQQALKNKQAIDDLINRISVGRRNNYGHVSMKKICDEAVRVTSRLAGGTAGAAFAQDKQRFLELYYGPMNLVEIWQRTDDLGGAQSEANTRGQSSIEAAMVRFGALLDSHPAVSTQEQRAALQERADDLKAQCDGYFQARNSPPR